MSTETMITAKRLGYETDLRWIVFKEGKVVEAITNDQKTVPIYNRNHLLKHYESLNSDEHPMSYLFSGIEFMNSSKKENKNKGKSKTNETKTSKTKKESVESSKESTKDAERKQSEDYEFVKKEPTPEPIVEKDSKQKADRYEKTYVLNRYYRNERVFTMEYESFKDLKEDYQSMAVQYKESTFDYEIVESRFYKKTFETLDNENSE